MKTNQNSRISCLIPEASIYQYAFELFDEVGVVRSPDREDCIVILGLEQTPETDMDDFSIEVFPEEQSRKGEPPFRFHLDGFAKVVQPKLEKLSKYILRLGYQSEILGRYGYPNSSISLKQLAVTAGLGRQGKHTVLLHPKYGPWLRLAALTTNAPIQSTGPGAYIKEENPLCENCSTCLQACPVEGLLTPYRLENPNLCLASFNDVKHLDVQEGKVKAFCMKCLEVCPIADGKNRRSRSD